MKENEHKLFSLTPEKMAELSLKVTPERSVYKLNVNKIKTIKDIKLILERMDLSYSPKSKEDYDEIKHLLLTD